MRIKNTKEKISYTNTHEFFNNRAKKYNEDNPYSVTMYQDDNPELVRARNQKETERIIPKLKLDVNSKILDIACGIGRYSDAVDVEIEEYCGIDFCEDFINFAKERTKEQGNRFFYVSMSSEVEKCLKDNSKGKYNRILLIGSLMYLNDDDMESTFKQIESVAEEKAIVCIREPIGLTDRLTLKEQFSDELKDKYNAIYRTRDELVEYLNNTLIVKGFSLIEEGPLFEDANLNNRKETAQYYFILER